jgi:hypothetical protein
MPLVNFGKKFRFFSFDVRTFSRCLSIFKNLVLQALGTIRFWFLQKKEKNKFHACVPLNCKLD